VTHLDADQLVDLAEGARPESSAPHLAVCEQCRRQVGELRAMMSAAADVDVPEPSPLFWDHLSQRVHDAVAVDAAAARLSRPRSILSGWLGLRLSGWLGLRAMSAAAVLVVASLVLAVMFESRVMAPHRMPLPPGAVAAVFQAAPPPDLLSDSPVENDASLSVVAGLAAELDAEAANEAGLATVGSADHAVTHMNAGELRELQRLLKVELTPSGD
jgi:hypothetical protein